MKKKQTFFFFLKTETKQKWNTFFFIIHVQIKKNHLDLVLLASIISRYDKKKENSYHEYISDGMY